MDKIQQDFEGRMKEFHATTTDLWEISRETMLQLENDILRSLGIRDSWVVGDEETYHWKDAMEAQLCEQGLQDKIIVADLDFKSWSIEFATFTVEIQENDETQKVTCLQVLEYYPGGGSLTYRVPQSVRSLVKFARSEG